MSFRGASVSVNAPPVGRMRACTESTKRARQPAGLRPFPSSIELLEPAPMARESTSETTPKKAFVAGATGFTGRALALQDASRFGVDVTLQVRDRARAASILGSDPRLLEIALDDAVALTEALTGQDAVVQLIGTVRAKFDAKTSYESVDYGTTVALVDAARRARVPHVVLLSSIGAGTGLGAYLSWKKRTEHVVINSGIPYTILRPSYLAGDDVMTDRAPATALSAFLGGMSDNPLGAPFALVRPISIQGLARIILDVVRTGPPKNGGVILRGTGLFDRLREIDAVDET
jgi:uncharacterized protein YbjT (DUF2867 family)